MQLVSQQKQKNKWQDFFWRKSKLLSFYPICFFFQEWCVDFCLLCKYAVLLGFFLLFLLFYGKSSGVTSRLHLIVLSFEDLFPRHNSAEFVTVHLRSRPLSMCCSRSRPSSVKGVLLLDPTESVMPYVMSTNPVQRFGVWFGRVKPLGAHLFPLLWLARLITTCVSKEGAQIYWGYFRAH